MLQFGNLCLVGLKFWMFIFLLTKNLRGEVATVPVAIAKLRPH